MTEAEKLLLTDILDRKHAELKARFSDAAPHCDADICEMILAGNRRWLAAARAGLASGNTETALKAIYGPLQAADPVEPANPSTLAPSYESGYQDGLKASAGECSRLEKEWIETSVLYHAPRAHSYSCKQCYDAILALKPFAAPQEAQLPGNPLLAQESDRAQRPERAGLRKWLPGWLARPLTQEIDRA